MWRQKEKLDLETWALSDGIPSAGELRTTIEKAKAAVAKGAWAIMVFSPGAGREVTLPSLAEFPPMGAPLSDVLAFSQRFGARRYWGGAVDLPELEARVRGAWRNTGELPETADLLLTALGHRGWYCHAVGGTPADEDLRFLHALLEAARRAITQAT